MTDALAQSPALLEKLVREVMLAEEPVKYDELAAKIRRVIEERDHLKAVIAAQHDNPKRNLEAV